MDIPHRPLLFLDVDGPLIPFGGTAIPASAPKGSNPLLAQLDTTLGPHLVALDCEMLWATTWMDEANRVVGPVLGLPQLPVVAWRDGDPQVDTWFGLHWKTRTLVARAAGRTFVWIDDEIGAGDREWVADHHAGRALLHRVDPRIGLQHSDFRAIAEWLDIA